VGELTASIAHEVNQPLAAVVTNGNACLRWLAAEPSNLDEARKAVERIIRDANRASEVIARIRMLLKKNEPVKTRLNPNQLIRDIVPLVEAEARRHDVSVQTELAANLPRVTGDRVQLQQVLLNLVVNALDAMSTMNHGRRILRLQTSRIRNEVVQIAVRDSGVGLAAQNQERLFEAFYTTKPQGLGMGLSISRSIVESHGGRLWAAANHGPGATFLFTLPIRAGGAA
jgi:signal transduction histidine kinase